MDMLKELKKNGYKIAVLSNKAQYAVTKLCDIYFNNLLDDAVGARENVAKKPSPDALYICSQENNNIILTMLSMSGDSAC